MSAPGEASEVATASPSAVSPSAVSPSAVALGSTSRSVLVIDVGGTHVKALATGQVQPVKFDSGPSLTPTLMVANVQSATAGWNYDVIAMGVPAPVVHGRIIREPVNLAPGWVSFDFQEAFGKPVRIANDAVMQALGGYSGGRMLFLGLGTGLGAAVIDEGHPMPLEIAHLAYKRRTYEEYLGAAGLKRVGHDKWERRVHRIAEDLCKALVCEYVVLGGGNAKELETLPPHARLGDNANAFLGGFNMWAEPTAAVRRT